MSNTPSDAEILALAQEQLKAFAQFVGAGEVWFEGEIEFARAVLAKWGTPQPVVRAPLTDAQLEEMMRETWGCASIAPRHAETFARAIEAEVRKQDEALIRQMLESMCWAARVMAISEDEAPGYFAAITAARARLGEKT